MKRYLGLLSFSLFAFAQPVPAQAPDPFQSAPGPAVAPPKAAARPHPPRPAHRPEPEREPVNGAHSLAPAQTATPAAIAAPRSAPEQLAARFDGIWVGQWQCEATRQRPAFSHNVIIEVKNSQVARLGATSTVPGAPGYDKWDGTVAPDGRALMRREWVGTGVIPGSARLGEQGSAQINGLFSGDSYAGTAHLLPGRECSLNLRRRR